DDFSFDLDLEDEPPAPLAADEALLREADIGSATTRYDLSFDESPEAAEEDEFALDLEDDFLSDSDEVKAAPEISSASFEDDLGELSFELEDEPSATEAPASAAPAVEEDDFSFDFEETAAESAEEATFAFDDIEPAQDPPPVQPEVAEETAEDIKPDMDVSGLDQEALEK